MTVYVDAMFIPARVGRHSSRWCHLMSDQIDPGELHAFAARIGLRLAWFQPGRSVDGRRLFPPRDHYDVTEGKRRQAVRAGAIEIDRDAFVALLATRRAAWNAPNAQAASGHTECAAGEVALTRPDEGAGGEAGSSPSPPPSARLPDLSSGDHCEGGEGPTPG